MSSKQNQPQKSHLLGSTSGKMISKALILNNMKTHSAKLSNVKPAIDNTPPHTLTTSQLARDRKNRTSTAHVSSRSKTPVPKVSKSQEFTLSNVEKVRHESKLCKSSPAIDNKTPYTLSLNRVVKDRQTKVSSSSVSKSQEFSVINVEKRNHVFKLSKVTSAIDNRPPKTLTSSQLMRDRRCQSSVSKSVRSGTPAFSKSFCSGTPAFSKSVRSGAPAVSKSAGFPVRRVKSAVAVQPDLDVYESVVSSYHPEDQQEMMIYSIMKNLIAQERERALDSKNNENVINKEDENGNDDANQSNSSALNADILTIEQSSGTDITCNESPLYLDESGYDQFANVKLMTTNSEPNEIDNKTALGIENNDGGKHMD